MLQRFKKLMQSLADDTSQQESKQQSVNLAAAVLLVEVMMADHEVRKEELVQISDVLEKMFGIEKKQSIFLIEDARQRHHELVSLHEMTSIINEQRNQELKRKLIFAMWCIAYADQEKDKYEEHLIRKVADLLYLSHSDFIQARHKAEKHHKSGRSFTEYESI